MPTPSGRRSVRFYDGRVDAAGVQCECGRQAADPRSGNENVFSHAFQLGARLP